jgi:hypothetical protein
MSGFLLIIFFGQSNEKFVHQKTDPGVSPQAIGEKNSNTDNGDKVTVSSLPYSERNLLLFLLVTITMH